MTQMQKTRIMWFLYGGIATSLFYVLYELLVVLR